MWRGRKSSNDKCTLNASDFDAHQKEKAVMLLANDKDICEGSFISRIHETLAALQILDLYWAWVIKEDDNLCLRGDRLLAYLLRAAFGHQESASSHR